MTACPTYYRSHFPSYRIRDNRELRLETLAMELPNRPYIAPISRVPAVFDGSPESWFVTSDTALACVSPGGTAVPQTNSGISTI